MAEVSKVLEQAIALKNQGKYAEAEPLYYAAIKENPRESENYYSIAD
jgi:hypothetical protein